MNKKVFWGEWRGEGGKKWRWRWWTILGILSLVLASGCGESPPNRPAGAPLRVLVVESFLADLAQNVAGDRLTVQSLLPVGADPHGYQPTPADVTRVVECDVLIVNGAGLEDFLSDLLQNAGGQHRIVVASAGLVSRTPQAGEPGDPTREDPHFWLDPNLAIRYVENIRDGLAQADPAGREIYAQNAAAYITQLRALDAWISEQVRQIPLERRLLVTNHGSLGYFADRYGFRMVGTVIPGVSTDAAPSAQELARLVDRVRATGAPAIFIEAEADSRLAQQVAQEAGITVVTGLYTHSPSEPGGEAPTYIEMIRYNTRVIVEALK